MLPKRVWLILVLMGVIVLQAINLQAQPNKKLSPEEKFQQDQQLAQEYARRGENEKVVEILSSYAKKKETLPVVFPDIRLAYQNLNKQEEIEKLLKRLIGQDPTYRYRVELIDFYAQNKNSNKEEDETKQLLKLAGKNILLGESAAQYAFEKLRNPNLAIALYTQMRIAAKSPYAYARPLAQAYKATGKTQEMLKEVFSFLEVENPVAEAIQQALLPYITSDAEYDLLEKIVLDKLAEPRYANDPTYIEMLAWIYLQKKDFDGAFIQSRALDLRENNEGRRCMQIAQLARENKEFRLAISIYEYVAKTWAAQAVAVNASRLMLNTREELIKESYPINKEDVQATILAYDRLNKKIGNKYATIENRRSMALLYGFYMDNLDSAQILLEEIVRMGGNPTILDKSKLDLGDIYLLKGEPWESTLLYSQVEKTQKESPLGHEAKLKNAKLSYFKGEFQLAQEHLDVLKIATSREISNDAMDLSLRIQDNTFMDSTGEALKIYSKAELLLFQHKPQEALNKLQILFVANPKDPIADDVLWLKAKIYVETREFDKAVATLDTLIKNYGQDLYGDDALYLKGTLLEEKLGDTQQAMATYEQILEKYPSSVFATEARKRFRTLRGDVLK